MRRPIRQRRRAGASPQRPPVPYHAATFIPAPHAQVVVGGGLSANGSVTLFSKVGGDSKLKLGALRFPRGIRTKGDLQLNWWDPNGRSAAGMFDGPWNSLGPSGRPDSGRPFLDSDFSFAAVELGSLQVAGTIDSTAPTSWNITGDASVWTQW